jgi:hypothetical protein
MTTKSGKAGLEITVSSEDINGDFNELERMAGSSDPEEALNGRLMLRFAATMRDVITTETGSIKKNVELLKAMESVFVSMMITLVSNTVPGHLLGASVARLSTGVHDLALEAVDAALGQKLSDIDEARSSTKRPFPSMADVDAVAALMVDATVLGLFTEVEREMKDVGTLDAKGVATLKARLTAKIEAHKSSGRASVSGRGATAPDKAGGTTERTPTRVRLAQAIREAGLSDLASRAAQGEFDDFGGPHAAPCQVLVGELNKAGLRHLAERAMQGEFDASKEEADAWTQSQQGRELLKRFSGGPSPAGKDGVVKSAEQVLRDMAAGLNRMTANGGH